MNYQLRLCEHRQHTAWHWLRANPGSNSSMLALAVGVCKRSAYGLLRRLVDYGCVLPTGNARNTRWYVTAKAPPVRWGDVVAVPVRKAARVAEREVAATYEALELERYWPDPVRLQIKARLIWRAA